MTLTTPLWMQGGTYSGTLDRELIDAVFPQGGIISSGDLAVSQRGLGANMSVDVAAGKCVVVGSDESGQGKYLCKSDAVVNVTIATAPGTGNSRIDLIVAQVRDVDAIGGSNNDWIITAVTGSAVTTGTQVAPATPASALVLARIAVGPSVTSISNANISTFPNPATNRAIVSGKLNSPYTCTGTPTTILTTPTLSIGKWQVCFTGAAQLNSGSAAFATVTMLGGTATATFPGASTATATEISTAGAQSACSFMGEVDVSVAGTIVFQASGTLSEILAGGATAFTAIPA